MSDITANQLPASALKDEAANKKKRRKATIDDGMNPEIILVYGSMNPKIFGPYLKSAQFVRYPDWITRVKSRKQAFTADSVMK